MGLRAKLSQPGKRHAVELDVDGEKVVVEVREMNMAQKSALFTSAGGFHDDGTPKDTARFFGELVRCSTYEPGTATRVFSTADEVTSAGPHLDPLIKKCQEMFNPPAEELRGKSEATAGTDPASPSPIP